MRILRVVGFAAVVVALIAIALPALASADEPAEGETFVTRLEPGDNFVGWVGQAAPVEELLKAVPQMELVYAWDADRQRYEYFVPGGDASGESLDQVTSEMSVVIRIGEEPLSIEDLFAAVPEIQLIYRWDTLAQHWDFALRALGPNHWSIDVLAPDATATIRVGAEPASVQALFDAAPQIDLMYRYDETGDSYSYAIPGLAPAVGGLQMITPGMGVMIRIDGEAVEWERPFTPVKGLVELRSGENWVAWSGRDDWSIADVAKGIGKSLTEVRSGDLIYDPARPETAEDWPSVKRGDALEVTVSRNVNWLQPTDVVPAIHIWGTPIWGTPTEKTEANFRAALEETFIYYTETFGIQADPSGYQIVLFGTYQEYLDRSGHDTPQYDPARFEFVGTGGWAGGTELWVHVSNYERGAYAGLLKHEYMHVLQHQLASHLHSTPQWITEGQAEFPGLGPIDYEVFGGRGSNLDDSPYLFGAIAARLLAKRTSIESLLDFWRILYDAKAWPEAFTLAFGISPGAFREELQEWWEMEVGGGKVVIAVRTDDGEPLAGWWVEVYAADAVAGPLIVGRTNAMGTFDYHAKKDRRYLVGFGHWHKSIETCWRYYDSEAGSSTMDDAVNLVHGSQDRLEIDIVLDFDDPQAGGECGYMIRGTLLDASDRPVADTTVCSWHEDGWYANSGETNVNGVFFARVWEPGSYYIAEDTQPNVPCDQQYDQKKHGETLAFVAPGVVRNTVLRVRSGTSD